MVELFDLCYRARGFGPLSLRLEGGQVVMVCGPSGSGKSTLCQLLLGDLDPSQGKVSWALGARCGYLGAEPESQLLGSTVGQELEFSQRAQTPSYSASWSQLQEQLLVRFSERMGEDPHLLSKGEQQVLLLSSLIIGPYTALVLDEGLSGLDEVTFEGFCRLLRQVAEAGGLVLLVSHEPRLLRWVDRVLGMDSGQLKIDAPVRDLTWGQFNKMRLWPGVLPPGPEDETVWRTPPSEVSVRQALGASVEEQAITLPHPLDLCLAGGEAMALAGVSGSGKRRTLQHLFFNPELSALYRVMLTDNPIAMLSRRSVLAELSASLALGRARGLEQQEWGLPEEWLARSPRTLSTGQTKLTACRCLILQNPDLLLLEEPFSGLDSQLRATLEDWLRQYLAAGGRLVFTTHNPDEMCLYPDILVVVDKAAPIWVARAGEDFTTQPESRLGAAGFVRRPLDELQPDVVTPDL